MKSAPLVLQSATDRGRSLRRSQSRAGDQRNENWMQQLLFEHPELLPVAEFGDVFTPPIPIGREIATSAGSIDILYVSPSGGVIVVETKLWKNPEQQRTVVAQVIDYAKELAKWDYDALDDAVRKAPRPASSKAPRSIDDLVRPHLPDGIDVQDFQERVISNLLGGRFLLLIVGDRISPNLMLLSQAVSGVPGLDFRLGLVELQMYPLGPAADWPCVVVPDVVGRTVEVTRGVVKVQFEEKRPVVAVSSVDSEASRAARGKTTKVEFLGRVSEDLAPVYERWFAAWEAKGFVVYWGVLGFSVRLNVNGKLQTLLDGYPEWPVKLIRPSDAEKLRVPAAAYATYRDALATLPGIASVLAAGKLYPKSANVSAETLDALFSAATALVPYVGTAPAGGK